MSKKYLSEVELAAAMEDILKEMQDDTTESNTSDSEDSDHTSVASDVRSEVSADELSSDEDTPEEVDTLQKLYGKDGYEWSTRTPPRRGRPLIRNHVSEHRQVKGAAREVKTSLEAWKLLFSDNLISKIMLHTNEEIDRQAPQYKSATFVKHTTLLELDALFGLYYILGSLRVSNQNLEVSWSNEYGINICRATMSLKRFQFLTTCLRFDDKNSRSERRKSDKFAPIREIWEMFINNCKQYYTPGEYCTIDEQLLGTRSRCSFKMYMPAKPDKYGIKILMMNDATTFYMVNAMPYVGAVIDKDDKESVPEYYVRKLSEPIYGSYRNITMDNWFTSIPMAQKMLVERKLTILGTLRKNKREIPKECLAKVKAGTSLFLHDSNKTLVSYSPKDNKKVLVLSTMHYDNGIDIATGKPNMIVTYNQTKGGTDSFDQLCHSYTTARKTKRWPMRVFYGMLDQAGINSRILHFVANSDLNIDKSKKRASFLRDLGFSLVKPYLEYRRLIPGVQDHIIKKINLVIGEPTPSAENISDQPTATKRKRCQYCPCSKDRKTNMKCETCEKHMCAEHRSKKCCNCA